MLHMEIASENRRIKRTHGRRIRRNKRKHYRNTVSFQSLVSIFRNNGRHHLLCKLGYKATKLYSFWKEYITVVLCMYSSTFITAYCSHELFPKIDKLKKFFKKSNGIDLIDLGSIFRQQPFSYLGRVLGFEKNMLMA